jgi:DNA-binding transcriptional LysR family regulator
MSDQNDMAITCVFIENRAREEKKQASKSIYMDLKRLRYFCAIVEQGQISRAARVLHISQPPLSQRLKELEEELGAPLIIREDGQWEVTEAGKMLYEQASSILSRLDNLKRQVVDAGGQICGLISIGVSTTCESPLLDMLPRLHEEFPAVSFQITVMDSSYLEKEIQDKKLDIAILLLPLESDDYEIRHLPPGDFSVVYSPLLSAPDQAAIHLDDLLDTPLLLSRRSSGGGHYAAMMRHWQQRGQQPRVLLTSHNIQTLLRLIDVGMPAATIVPTTEVPEAMRSRCHVRPLLHAGLCLYPVLITKKGRFMSRAARHVADAIVLAADIVA